MNDPTASPIHALRHGLDTDPRPYADLRRRFRHALGSLLPAAAVFPLVVVLEEIEEYATCGPARSNEEKGTIGRVLDALLAYREAYQAGRGSVGSEGPAERSRWSVFLDGMSVLSASPPPPAPPAGTQETDWPRWVRAWVAAGSPAEVEGGDGWVRDFHARPE